MAAYAPIKIQHTPVNSWPGTVQTGFVGAQTVSGQRGTLPTFNDSNSYFVAKTGLDSNAGTAAAPKLTLGSMFSTTQSFNDTSGAGRNLVEAGGAGTTPYISYPCRPIPPQGNFAAGPFDDTNYLQGPAGLRTAFQSITTFTIEGWFFVESLAALTTLWIFADGANNYGQIQTDGSIRFGVNSVNLDSAAGSVVVGNWYYIAFVYTSVTAGGKQIWLGTSPETAVMLTSATQTRTTGATVTTFYFGKNSAAANQYLIGYMDRLVLSLVARTSFPTSPSASNIAGFYEMETRPLMQTAAKSYIVIADSGTYNEGLYANFQNDITAGFGIYAAEGQAPTFKLQKGVFPGTYGAGNSSYVPLTASPSTTCYVSKAGNNGTGARGNPALPFLTVQAALTATTTAGDTVEIQDSGTYIENLSVPNRNLTIQASAGSVPVIKPGSTTYVFTMVSTSNLSVAGILFIGTQLKGFIFGAGAAIFVLQDCSMNNLGSLSINTAGSTVSYYDCFIDTVAGFGAASVLIFNNCFFDSDFIVGVGVLTQLTISNCNFTGTLQTRGNRFTHILGCKLFGELKFINDVGGGSFGVLNCEFEAAAGLPNITTSVDGSDKSLISNCIFKGNVTSTWAVKSLSGCLVWIYNCLATGYARGFYLVGTQTASRVYNCSTLNCSTAGVDAVSSVVARGLADFGSGAAYQSGVTPTSSISDADYLSTSTGSENLTLSANSPGAFLVDDNIYNLDAGIQAPLFNLVLPSVTINGLIFEGEANQEGGILSRTAVTVSYCTFSGLGPYGVLVPASSTVNNCLFNTNGHAIKDGQYSTIIQYNAAYACGGAFLQHYGRATYIDHNTAFACQYGQYDSLASSFSVSFNNIYIGSGAFDYSGEDELTYSDVGTLDPDRANSLDANSIRTDPLFVNADGGDLTLQALAREFFWQSPAIGAGSSSTDMGAYIWTYGTLSTSWTTIDFATATYRNPDTVLRRQLPIKLAEGDMENGAIYSVQATFKKEYEFTWNPASSDMPLEQLYDLIDMFLAPTNQIQIDFGDGLGYVPAFFGRNIGFEYADMTGLYSDDEVPEPLRTMLVRIA